MKTLLDFMQTEQIRIIKQEQYIITLQEVVYDERARDGTWCQAPYPNHKKGCPNFPKCIEERPRFKAYQGYTWYAVTEEFDLAAHAEKMKAKHPHWTNRQCRNLLYWQGGVRKRLRIKAEGFCYSSTDVLLDIPEANGVNVFATMAKHGVFLKANPDYVTKVMLVGKILKNGGN